jgi:hypothetical protein
MDLLVLTGYLATGVAAGFAAGLFGIGGGIIGVPALLYLLPRAGVPPEHLMHVALGSSLAAILFTSGSSAWNHHRRGAVDVGLLGALAPGLLAGALAGGLAARGIDGLTLRAVFGAFVLGVAVWLAFGREPTPRPASVRATFAIALAIGALAALVGVGGGIMVVPWLLLRGATAHVAVGTSAAATLPVALAGAAGYALGGLGVSHLPAYSTGFVHWPAVAGMALGAWFAARWGVALAHRLPARRLRRAFAAFVALMGLDVLTN